MDKKIIFGVLIAILLIGGLFVLTGCSKKNDNTTNSKTENSTSAETVENKEKVAFTKEVAKTRVKYKVPESIDAIGSFNKVTINGVEYETYKYVEKTMIHYVYRTQIGNFYHLFTYDVYGKEYDDSQVEAFMNTVEFITE